MKVSLFPHSAVDVITNSSTELFCEITSEQHLPLIKEYLENILGRNIYITPFDTDDEYDEKYVPCIQFEVEYMENNGITSDFCALLDACLTNLVGKGNFKIDRDVSY